MIPGYSRSGCKHDWRDGRVGVLEFRACFEIAGTGLETLYKLESERFIFHRLSPVVQGRLEFVGIYHEVTYVIISSSALAQN